MTLEEQRQDILSGAVYDDLTPELIEARQAAVLLTNAYNQAFGQDEKIRQDLLKKLLKSFGDNCYFEPNFRCEFGYNITIGNNFYANFDCVLLDGGGIEIEIGRAHV